MASERPAVANNKVAPTTCILPFEKLGTGSQYVNAMFNFSVSDAYSKHVGVAHPNKLGT